MVLLHGLGADHKMWQPQIQEFADKGYFGLVLDQLRNLHIPALIMVGDQFGQWFVKINRKIAAALQESKSVILEEAMDPSNLVNPVDFNREVLLFLEDNTEQLLSKKLS
jgi:pimeloyl-ACP methyl ester carboxylesterase